MTICQTCGGSKRNARLILCEKCKLVVHRYCMDDTSMMLTKIKTKWFCNSCRGSVVRKPVSLSRSEGISRNVDRASVESINNEATLMRRDKNSMLNRAPKEENFPPIRSLVEKAKKVQEDKKIVKEQSDKLFGVEDQSLGFDANTRHESRIAPNEIDTCIVKEKTYVVAAKRFGKDGNGKDSMGSCVTEDRDLKRSSTKNKVKSHGCIGDNQAKNKRRLILNADDLGDDEMDFVATQNPNIFNDLERKAHLDSEKSDISQLDDFELRPNLQPLPSSPTPTCFNNFPTQPIFDVAWRGNFCLNHNTHILSIGLLGHLSNKAPLKMHGVAYGLSESINFEVVSKPRDSESISFKSDDISLYFFPCGESDEKAYERMLSEMVENHLFLTTKINNLELIVFPSSLLPQEHWRYQRKYYMWGMFKPMRQTVVSIKPPLLQPNNGLCNFTHSGIKEKQNYVCSNYITT